MVKRRILVIIVVSLLLGTTLFGAATLGVIAGEPVYHTVKWGETLSRISWMYGVTVQQIVEANELANSNVIYAGQQLLIPVPSEEYVVHIVQAGESLLSIAAKYGVSVWDIARRNGIWNINLIYVGQKLTIPGEGEEPPAPEPTPWVMPQEAIIITSPAMNAEVTSPVTVTGWGSGFENNLAVDVLDGAGSVLGQGYVLVNAEFGQFGPFTGAVEFAAPAIGQLGRISVYGISPRDGAIEHLASVTVKLSP